MTSGFQFTEPDVDPAAIRPSALVADPESALAMVNHAGANGLDRRGGTGDTDASSLDDDLDDDDNQDEEPEPELYSDEDYAEMRRQAEEEYALELTRLENEHMAASVDLAQHQDELKYKKSVAKQLLEDFRKLQADGPDYPSREKPREPVVTIGVDVTANGINTSLDVSTPEHEAYLNKRTVDVLKGIEGLGPKKLDALVATAPTVRELEALRAKASDKSLGDFKDVLPDGFGEALADRIENALMKALAVGGSAS